jgi:hypothetical protein
MILDCPCLQLRGWLDTSEMRDDRQARFRFTTPGRPKWLLLAATTLSLVPCNARADAGTPLMWAGIAHLVVGNLFIGLFEGILLAKVFSLGRGKSVLLMIAANYFSAWFGDFFLTSHIARSIHMDLNNGWCWFWTLVVGTYLMTLVLEWPFVAFCFRPSAGWFKRSLKGNFLVQTASYLLLFGWYWMASGTGLYTQMHVVPPGDISMPPSVLLYFIGEQDGNVYIRNFSGSINRKVFDLQSTDGDDRLLVRQSAKNTNDWDIVARVATQDFRNPKFITIQSNFIGQAVLDARSSLQPPQYEGTWFNFGKISKLGAAAGSDWNFRSGFWAIEGFSGENQAKHAGLHFSLETPFAQWVVRNATHLPSDKVVLQLGENQICILDPDSKRIALLTHGRGPVAVIPK